jgi:hypothetical protein
MRRRCAHDTVAMLLSGMLIRLMSGEAPRGQPPPGTAERGDELMNGLMFIDGLLHVLGLDE